MEAFGDLRMIRLSVWYAINMADIEDKNSLEHKKFPKVKVFLL